MSVKIYAGEPFYITAPEPEVVCRGVLTKRNQPLGPASRGGLNFTLVTPERHIPIYVVNVPRSLKRLVGHQVAVRGKLVDLSAEGFGQELWPESVQEVGSN